MLHHVHSLIVIRPVGITSEHVLTETRMFYNLMEESRPAHF